MLSCCKGLLGGGLSDKFNLTVVKCTSTEAVESLLWLQELVYEGRVFVERY